MQIRNKKGKAFIYGISNDVVMTRLTLRMPKSFHNNLKKEANNVGLTLNEFLVQSLEKELNLCN